MKKLLLISTLAALSCCFAAQAKLPDPLLSGYTGLNFKRPKNMAHIEKMIREMGKNNFNSLDLKVQHNLRGVEFTPQNVAKMQKIYDLCKANNMILQIYLYPMPYDGLRRAEWEEHSVLPAPVDAKGKEIANSFLLTDIRVWQSLFRHAPQWLELRKKIPFVSLKFDIETISIQYSYDDVNWKKFCAKYPRFSPDTPANQRGKLIKKARFTGKYYTFFQNEVEKTIKQWFASLRALDADVMFGYMPARQDKWIAQIFERHMATDTVPAICDGWDMYNGSGYTDAIKKHADNVKKNHKNNILITWIRPNSYEPEDISISVYHTAANTPGYSIWTLYMLDEALNKKHYALPGKWKAEDYFKAFGKANAATCADMKAGTRRVAKRIPYRATKPLVAPLNLAVIKTPEFLPDGNGSGENKEFLMRNQQVIRLYAQAGEKLEISLRHLSKKHKLSLQYALFDQQKNILHNEAVNPGRKTRISVVAPHTGCYTFTVSGGTSQAWYGITVHTKYYAFDAENQAYFFSPQTVYMPGKNMGNPKLKIDMRVFAQSHTRKINDGTPVSTVRNPLTVTDLPDGIVKVEFSDYKASGTYTQDFFLGFPGGKNHLIFGHPERRLKMK